MVALASADLFVWSDSLPGWRNWQTQKVLEAHIVRCAGSSPVPGTTVARGETQNPYHSCQSFWHELVAFHGERRPA